MKKQGRPFFSSLKTYPTHAELAALDRDLQFSPCTNTEPAVLNRAQIEQFNEHGYLHGLPIFDRDQADELRQYCDEIMAAEMARGGTSYSLASAHLKHGRIYDLQRHPAIVPIIINQLDCATSVLFPSHPRGPGSKDSFLLGVPSPSTHGQMTASLL